MTFYLWTGIFPMLCGLFTLCSDYRGSISWWKTIEWYFPLSGIRRPPSACVSASLCLPPLFPPPPSAVTKQTGQVINSGATTLNLLPSLMFFLSPLVRSAMPQTRMNVWLSKRCETVKEVPLSVCVFVSFYGSNVSTKLLSRESCQSSV